VRAAVLTGREQLELRDIPVPVPDRDGVVCRVQYAGICGSDLHAYRELSFAVGTVMGHECVGVIEAVGEDVPESRLGERVVIKPAFHCGSCEYCQGGAMNLCIEHIGESVGTGAQGAFAEFVPVKDYMAVRLPVGITDRVATLTEPLSCCVHAVRRSALRLGDRVAVFGAGPIGLLTVACAKRAGAEVVVVWERSELRREMAKALGADYAIDDLDGVPDGSDAAELLAEKTDVVFECAGHPKTMSAAIHTVKKGGQVVLVGMAAGEVSLQQFRWVEKEIDVKASINCLPNEFGIALRLLESGAIDAERLLTATVPLERIEEEGFRLLQDPGRAIKILVTPDLNGSG
jgi:2-desacetyl-2-hydroxyethyl bacteriochlorophyllide A dehydrogenase